MLLNLYNFFLIFNFFLSQHLIELLFIYINISHKNVILIAA